MTIVSCKVGAGRDSFQVVRCCFRETAAHSVLKQVDMEHFYLARLRLSYAKLLDFSKRLYY